MAFELPILILEKLLLGGNDTKKAAIIQSPETMKIEKPKDGD